MRLPWPLLIVVVLLLLAGIWFLGSHERVARMEPVPPADRAWREPYLAMQSWLERSGIRVREVLSLEGVPALGGDTLAILPAGRGTLTQAALEQLRSAVHDGARLLVEAEEPELDDPVLETFGIIRSHEEESAAWGSWTWRQWRQRSRASVLDDAQLLRVEREGADPLRVLQFGSLGLDAETPRYRVTQDDLARMLCVDHGRGWVLAMVDLGPFGNFGIGRNDHAEFLHMLLHDPQPPREVLLLRNRTPGFGPWLWQNAWQALLSLALLLLLWLWRIGARFGPSLADPEPARRRLLDHLRAAGRLLWSRRAYVELTSAAREQALRALARRHPGWSLLSPRQRQDFLCRHFGLAPEGADLLLGAPAQGAGGLLSLARAARELHRQLGDPQRGGDGALYHESDHPSGAP